MANDDETDQNGQWKTGATSGCTREGTADRQWKDMYIIRSGHTACKGHGRERIGGQISNNIKQPSMSKVDGEDRERGRGTSRIDMHARG